MKTTRRRLSPLRCVECGFQPYAPARDSGEVRMILTASKREETIFTCNDCIPDKRKRRTLTGLRAELWLHDAIREAKGAVIDENEHTARNTIKAFYRNQRIETQ